MSIKVESTTDTKEGVANAMAGVPLKKTEVENKSASSEKEKDETVEESEPSEEAEESEAEESEEDSQEEKLDAKSENQKPKQRGGFQKKIDKLIKQRSAKEQEAEYWKSEALKHQKRDETPKTAAPKIDVGSRPVSDNFETHDEFIEALTDWKLENKIKENDQKQKQTQMKSEFEKAMDTHRGRVKAFAEEHDDFHELMEEVDDVRMSITVQDAILESENGPALMYELAKNRKEFERICALSPMTAARELGKFEARLLNSAESSKEEKEEIKTTKAPKPIAPVGLSRSGSAKKTIHDRDLTQREYEDLRAQQRSKRA